MGKGTRAPRAAKAKAKGSVGVVDFAVDPLLVGADQGFVESFPAKLLADCGALPLRRYHGVGLVVTRSGPSGAQGLERLQRESDVRLVAVPAIHDYGVDLFLRYLETGPAQENPPLWLPESRRLYLTRQGEFTKPQPAPLVVSIVLTSPLASACPILVCPMGSEGHVLYLQGTGLKVGAKFPLKWFDAVLARLKIEFGLDGKKSPKEPWLEGRGLEQRGLSDLTALVLPPLDGPSFVIEPKNTGR